MVYIYTITNKATGRCYVGMTDDPLRRWSAHRSYLRRGDHLKDFVADWQTYTPLGFAFDIIDVASDRKAGLALEKEHVAKRTPNVYNKFYSGLPNDRPFVVRPRRFTADDIREMRALKDTVPAKELAARYGVSSTLISMIWSGKRYAWVQ